MDGSPSVGTPVYTKPDMAWWFVIRAASGKLVVYRRTSGDKCGSIGIYDSFDAMKPHVPDEVFEEAAIKAGLRPPKEYLEAPLDV